MATRKTKSKITIFTLIGIAIIAIYYFVMFYFFTIQGALYEKTPNLGNIYADFGTNWDGYHLTFSLEKDSPYWGEYYHAYQWDRLNIIFPYEMKDCVQRGMIWFPERNFCYKSINEDMLIYKNATLTMRSGYIYDLTNVSGITDNFHVNGIEAHGEGILRFNGNISIVCMEGETKCNGQNTYTCKGVTRNFDVWKEQWSANITEWTDEGIIAGRCGNPEPEKDYLVYIIVTILLTIVMVLIVLFFVFRKKIFR